MQGLGDPRGQCLHPQSWGKWNTERHGWGRPRGVEVTHGHFSDPSDWILKLFLNATKISFLMKWIIEHTWEISGAENRAEALDPNLNLNLGSADCWVTLGRLSSFSDLGFCHLYNEGSSTYLMSLTGEDTQGHAGTIYSSWHIVGTLFPTKLHSTIWTPTYYVLICEQQSILASLSRKELY